MNNQSFFDTLPTFEFKDLVGRNLDIKSYSGECTTIIMAIDTKSGTIFILKEEREEK